MPGMLCRQGSVQPGIGGRSLYERNAFLRKKLPKKEDFAKKKLSQEETAMQIRSVWLFFMISEIPPDFLYHKKPSGRDRTAAERKYIAKTLRKVRFAAKIEKCIFWGGAVKSNKIHGLA